MAQSPLSLLILKRLKPKTLSLYNLTKFFSTSSQSTPSNLSARMSFVFEQIDVIEKERSQKDQTLERIRAWRESKTPQSPPTEPTQNSELGIDDKVSEIGGGDGGVLEGGGARRGEVEMVHPWPEWIELMERLVQQNYFDLRRKDEGKMVEELGLDVGVDEFKEKEEGLVGSEFLRDYRTVQNAFVYFGKDRFDILRSLSRQDIRLLVGYGCPSADKKVVFSSKLLRKHVHLDEGDVCSSCNLRNSCERAYLLTNKEDEARTIDLMRVLLAYGFDHINGFVTNKSVLKQKSVKTVVRKLLHEVVKLSAVPIDPNLPPPVIRKPPPKVKQPPPPPKKRVGRDDIEMKKGDWLCPKCDFMNFAKNTVCLQCDAKRPIRQLLPGEWECPECSFLNYRRNMSCFHCQCKRPPDEFMESKMQERQTNSRARPEKVVSRAEISNAWNFNFDDDESDGADVAAFEYADSIAKNEDSFDNRARNGDLRGNDGDFGKAGRYPDYDRSGSRIGFNDFDDDDDDIDSYELETQDRSSNQRTSFNFAHSENPSDMEDMVPSENKLPVRSGRISRTDSKQFKSRKAASPGTDDDFSSDSDVELSVHPKRIANNAAGSRQSKGRGPGRPSKNLTFESDEDYGLYSDADDDLDGDFDSLRRKARQRGSDRRDYQRLKNYGSEDDSFSDSEFDRNKRHSQRSTRGGNVGRPLSRWESSDNNQCRRSSKHGIEDDEYQSRNRWGGNKVDRASRRDSSGNNQRQSSKKHDMEANDFGFGNRRGGSKAGRAPRWVSGNNQNRRSNKYDMEDNNYEFKNRNRVIER